MSVRDAVVQADLNAFAEVLAPDVVWIGPYPGELCRNRGDVLEMFERWRQQEIRIQPTIVFERDDVLIVDSGLGGRHHVVVLDESLVSEVRVYPDRGAALASIVERPW